MYFWLAFGRPANIPYWFAFAQILFVAYLLDQHVHTQADALSYLRLLLFALVLVLVVLVVRTPIESFGKSRLGYEMGHNPNTIGIFGAIGSMLCLYFASEKKWYYLPGVAFLAVTVLSASRKGILMLVIGYALFLIFQARGKKMVRNLVIIAVLAVVASIAVMKIDFLYDLVGSRMEAMVNSFLGKDGDYSMNERAFFTDYALGMMGDHPIFGGGTNCFVTEMRRIEYKNIAYCHNNYLELLVTLGVVGLVLYYNVPLRVFVLGVYGCVKANNKIVLLVMSVMTMILLGEIFYVSFFDRFTQYVVMLMYLLLKTTVEENTELFGKGIKKWI